MESIEEVAEEKEVTLTKVREEDTLKGVTEEQTVDGEAAEARGRPAAEGEQARTCRRGCLGNCMSARADLSTVAIYGVVVRPSSLAPALQVGSQVSSGHFVNQNKNVIL